MIGTTLLDRYRIESELGHGGMGIVYHAFDSLLMRDVAIKVLTESTLGSEGRSKLLHEAQSAASLNHPNIISIYDAGEFEKLGYIIMEHIRGSSLYLYKPGSISEILAIAQQICRALEHAHAHGVIHRDLKPENVLIAEDGQVKLTDFGLARSVSSRLSVEGAVIGTVYYLPPEQALGRPVDNRTDLYALGVMLYELTTGRLPFIADDPLLVISQHIHAPVIQPRTYNPDIPAALNDLIVQMLSKEPDMRPPSARQVRQILKSIESGEDSIKVTGPQTAPLENLALGRMVGREREMGVFRNLWTRVSAHDVSQNVLFISGESGIGKTPLVREIESFVRISGGAALSSYCFEHVSLPYEPVKEIIRLGLHFLAEAVPGEKIKVTPQASSSSPLPDQVLASLISIAPDLYMTFPDVPPNPAIDPGAEQQRLFYSVLAMCEAISSIKPLLLIFEDIQWADNGTLAFLRYLARRTRASNLPILITLTHLDEDFDAGHPLAELIYDMNRDQFAASIRLSRFDREQTRKFLNMMLQDSISPDFLDAIYRETQGNPFFVEEVCKSMIDEGLLYRDNGNWHWPEDISSLVIPQNVRSTIHSRIIKLKQDTQDVLVVAALIGREFDFHILTRSCAKDEEQIIDSLEEAVRAQIIEETRRGNGEVFIFSHGLTMTTLRESISKLRQRKIHARIAAAVQELHPGEHAILAHHYAESGNEMAARVEYTRAGDHAARVYSNKDAVRYYSKALATAAEANQERFYLLASRARVYDLTAQRDQQRMDVEEMLKIAENLGDPELKIDALLAQTDLLLETNHLEARKPAETALGLAQANQDPIREARALRRLGYQARNQYDLFRSQQVLSRAIKIFREAGLTDQAASSLHILSLTLNDLGRNQEAIQAVEEALQISRQSGNRLQEATSLRRLAIAYMSANQHERALPYAGSALDLHRELGDRAEECHALNVLGLIATWVGTPTEAESYLRRSIKLSEEIGADQSLIFATENLIWNHYWRHGLLESGLHYLDGQLDLPLVINDAYLTNSMLSIKADLFIHLGQYDNALSLIDQVYQFLESTSGLLYQAKTMSAKARVWIELGNFPQAHESIEVAGTLLEGIEIPAFQGGINSLKAYYYLRNNPGYPELETALSLVEQAIEQLAGTDDFIDLCVAYSIGGLTLLELDQPEKALSLTTEAITTIENTPFTREDFLYVHSRTLRAANQTEAANRYLDLAYDRVRLVAGNTLDDHLREGWLGNISINRQILSDSRLYLGKPDNGT